MLKRLTEQLQRATINDGVRPAAATATGQHQQTGNNAVVAPATTQNQTPLSPTSARRVYFERERVRINPEITELVGSRPFPLLPFAATTATTTATAQAATERGTLNRRKRLFSATDNLADIRPVQLPPVEDALEATRRYVALAEEHPRMKRRELYRLKFQMFPEQEPWHQITGTENQEPLPEAQNGRQDQAPQARRERVVSA
jgi:hypothetical protein